MELDIDPEWVQLDVAHRPGDQYLVGWSRDFFTVVASPAGPPAAPPRLQYLRP